MEGEHKHILVVDLVLFSEVLAKLSNTSVDRVEPSPVMSIEFQLPPIAFLVYMALVKLSKMERKPVEHEQAVSLLALAESGAVFIV